MDLTSHLDSINVNPVTLATVQLLQDTRGATYITVCALTVVAWDWALALGEEVQTVKRCGRSLAVLAYLLARTSSMITFIVTLVFLIQVPPDENRCSVLFDWIGVMNMTASAAKAYLFLLRVRAIYDNSKLVTLLFGVGWLFVVCARITISFMIDTTYLKQIGHCAVTHIGSLPILSTWFNLAYDTCIFLSVSVRLASYTKLTGTPWISSFVRGHGLPHTMRHLLRDAQSYYRYVAVLVATFCGVERNVSSITILFNLLGAVIAISPVSPIYQAIFAVPAFVIESLMTCKVFRAMILRSMHPIQNFNLPVASAEGRTTAMSIFELDTFLELRIRTTSTICEDVE